MEIRDISKYIFVIYFKYINKHMLWKYAKTKDAEFSMFYLFESANFLFFTDLFESKPHVLQ